MFKKYIRNESGASAVEFALLSPILIFLLIGTVDMGFFVMDRFKLQNTASATAEYVAKAQSDTAAGTVAAEAYGRDFSGVTFSSEFSCECADGVPAACPVTCEEGDYQRRFVDVSLSATFTPIFPYPGLPESLPLQSTARMRVD